MVDILQGNAGWVQQLFLWGLVVYPVLTIPVVLFAFLGGREAAPGPAHAPPLPRSPEELWQAPRMSHPEAAWMPAPPPPPPPQTPFRRVEVRDGLSLEQLLDVLEAASRIERLDPAAPRREPRPVEPRALAAEARPSPLEDGRTLRAARRVAANPRMQGWIRDVARELLDRSSEDEHPLPGAGLPTTRAS